MKIKKSYSYHIITYDFGKYHSPWVCFITSPNKRLIWYLSSPKPKVIRSKNNSKTNETENCFLWKDNKADKA